MRRIFTSLRAIVLITLGFVLVSGVIFASSMPINGNPAPPLNSSVMPGNSAGPVSLMSNREFWLSCIILIFGLAIILIEFFLLRQVVENRTDEIAKIYTVTLIIIGTLVLISSGFTNEQIAPALGLFGTIAGYLLGRQESQRRDISQHDTKEQKNEIGT